MKSYCEKCGNLLEKDNTFYIWTSHPLSKAICSDCHDDYAHMRESLYSNGKTPDQQGVMMATRKWLNAP